MNYPFGTNKKGIRTITALLSGELVTKTASAWTKEKICAFSDASGLTERIRKLNSDHPEFHKHVYYCITLPTGSPKLSRIFAEVRLFTEEIQIKKYANLWAIPSHAKQGINIRYF